MRVSFTGELGYELNVPADHGAALWDWLVARGCTPYGTEAMHVLRAEKGFIIIGQETDGTATPDDVGLAWAIGKNKPDYVGKRSQQRSALAAPGRKQLVGLLSSDKRTLFDEGAQLVENPAQPRPMKLLGHVTSAYHSATIGEPIALAVLANGRARMGERIFVSTGTGFAEAKVVSPVFYDQEGARLNG